MKESLTPKQVARAIGVSESSLKRWCDRGLLPFTKTAGGHRRLTIDHVLEFLRRERLGLVGPEVLGLPASTGRGDLVLDRAREILLPALTTGDQEACTRVVFDLYLGNIPLATICDEVLAPVFESIGIQWQCDTIDVYQERRACELCMRVLNQLSMAIVCPSAEAPLALGCSGPGDNYVLPTRMVELVLRGAGWQASSLGCNLPFASMTSAIRDNRPKVFWLSISHVEQADWFITGCRELMDVANAHGSRLILGGRALSEEIRGECPSAIGCHHLADMLAQLTTDATAARPRNVAVNLDQAEQSEMGG